MSNNDTLWSDEEWRAAMSAADINDLPDEDFGFIEDGGTLDADGKTIPRDKRHFPIHDAAHVRNALARAPQSPFGDKAMPKILAAAKKFGIKVAEKKSESSPISPARQIVKRPRHRSGPSLGIELRSFSGLEVRDDNPDSNVVTLVGTPIVYDTPYFVRDGMGPRGGFDETMKPGVVSDLLAKGTDTRFLVGHNSSSLPLGRTTTGTLRLQDSPIGLQCEVDLDMRQTMAADLAIAVQRGDIDQMSIGMVVGLDKWDAQQENREIFALRELADVSAVVFPASPTTSLEVSRNIIAEQIVRSTPIESRARFRQYWQITREIRDGRMPEPELIDALSDSFRMLAEANDDFDEIDNEDRTNEVVAPTDTDETRAEPTPQDKTVASKLTALAQAHHDLMTAQMKDPDNATDPADQEMMAHIQGIGKLIGKAQATQAADGASDIPSGTLGGPDGTIGNSSTGDGEVANDGTGVASRSAETEIEVVVVTAPRKRMTTEELRRGAQRDIELARIERARREREKRNKS